MVVIGLGYVGLPLAQAAVRANLAVVGLDVSEHIVAGVNASKSHIDDLSDSDLAEIGAERARQPRRGDPGPLQAPPLMRS